MSIKLAVGFAGIHNPLILRKGLDGMAFAAITGHAGIQGVSVGKATCHSLIPKLFDFTGTNKEGNSPMKLVCLFSLQGLEGSRIRVKCLKITKNCMSGRRHINFV